MNAQHLFITPDAALQPRWREAFADAAAVKDMDAAAACSPGLIWLSTRLPEWKDALVLCARQHVGVPVVVLDLQPNERSALQALRDGARGYCHAMATPGLLREVAVAVRHGGVWVGPDLMARVVGAAHRALAGVAVQDVRLDILSPREWDVARAVAEGATNKEVATRLVITERTVKAHLSAVFEKLGVRDRLQLALLFAGEQRAGSPSANA